MLDESEEFRAFAENIQQEVIARADAAEDGALRSEAFAELVFDYLREAGEIDDGIACAFEARGMRCSGYYVSEDNDRLDLFLVVPVLDGAASTVAKADIDNAFRRLKAFFTRSTEGLHQGLESALQGFDMALSIWEAREDLSHVRLFVITDGIATVDQIENETIGEIDVSSHLWDVRRLARSVSSGANREPIRIDFEALNGSPVQCVSAAPPGSGYRCLVGIMPGDVLVGMYQLHGPRLLERNVRSFLQLKGKVNQSIRKTIMNEPEMFLAFNNGLSITASGLDVVEVGGGVVELRGAQDLQIVNGGQTTGSIYRAARKDKIDASFLQIPMKITEILSDGDVEEIAPRISQSANNQNKVNIADFSSNHPFHRGLEELSRQIWARPTEGKQRQTRWFFERARGQYDDAAAQNRTPAERRAWDAIHPRRQKVSKTDLAKFESTWSQLPHIVSRGAQKCYLDFMDRLDARGSIEPDEQYFKRAMARGILFKETERIVSRQQFGGYRANIVTYTLAWLSHGTAKRVDFDAIWNAQALPEPLADLIESICVDVNRHVTSPPGGQNITEWCKKEVCWERLSGRELQIPEAVERILVKRDPNARKTKHTLEDQSTLAEDARITAVSAVAAETWFSLSAWAKDTQSLQPWERSLAFTLGRNAGQGKAPSPKQALHGERILAEANSLGFRG